MLTELTPFVKGREIISAELESYEILWSNLKQTG